MTQWTLVEHGAWMGRIAATPRRQNPLGRVTPLHFFFFRSTEPGGEFVLKWH